MVLSVKFSELKLDGERMTVACTASQMQARFSDVLARMLTKRHLGMEVNRDSTKRGRQRTVQIVLR